ncbi:MAG: beta-ketoacyl-[acyl-carrier-protein] synthase family protein [Alphaproteobacteria bacterium]|nr:beta-ketoacyl-[acyl-carrier-protein] synthase family protein [Alphaproteobacteria bacterium]
MHRVAITGLGCISALGNDVASFWSALKAGQSGIGPVVAVPHQHLNIKIAAEVKNFDPAQHFDEKRLLLLDRFSQFALLAAREAVKASGISFKGDLGRETAVIIGTGAGGMNTLEDAYARLHGHNGSSSRQIPLTIPRLMVSAAASHVTMEFGVTGPSFAVSSACSSANHAIGEAFWMVKTGRARAALAGGSEACITLGTMKAWEALRVLAPDTCRPFSGGRKGMVLGEGGGVAVLERMEDARARGAVILAELAGFGMTSDAGDIVQPSDAGAAGAMSKAMQDGQIDPGDVGYVNAHGTGTMANDATETRALKLAFGNHVRKLMISSTKSMHGHVLGGAGAIELVAATMAVHEGVIPPTANYQRPDPACDLDYVPGTAREARVDAALSNSFAFGGLNAVLALKRAA